MFELKSNLHKFLRWQPKHTQACRVMTHHLNVCQTFQKNYSTVVVQILQPNRLAFAKRSYRKPVNIKT